MNGNCVLERPEFRVPESNLFLMTRFRDTTQHIAISGAVEEALAAFGLKLVRADNPNLRETKLWDKVQQCMEACHYGAAIFEAIDETDFNPNVSLELGYMMGLKRQLLLLKEQRVKELFTDLVGFVYGEFNSYEIRPTVLGQMADWLKQVRVRKQDGETLVVFVSYGGQDRCAIAKVITKHLLEEDKCTLNVRIESRGAENPSEPTAAKTGIEVVQNRLKRDWLSEHRPRKAGIAFLFEANLILATDREVLNKLLKAFEKYPGTDEDRRIVRDEIQQKTHLLSEFFGGTTDDIRDPFPDKQDENSREKYENCFNDLYSRISNHLSALTEFLEREEAPKTGVRTVGFGNRCLFGTIPV
jgi:protein-tyrosine-phosphatase